MRAARLLSTMIERICHDEDERSLSIWFRARGRYVYYDVPLEHYEGLRAAPSPGRYFNERIKGRFRCEFDPERRRFRPQRAA
jgi:hypothetical protein